MTTTTKLTAIAASVLALAATASADIKLNDSFSVNGYAVGDYQHADNQNALAGAGTSRTQQNLGLDIAKLGVIFDAKPFNAYVSGIFIPNQVAGRNSDFALLDAFLSYNFGNGVTVTGGKFLSYLGYEAFDPTGLATITGAYGSGFNYSNSGKFGPGLGGFGYVPAYHSGVKVDYSENAVSAGIAVLDSVYSADITRGDDDVKHVGTEAFVKYTGIEKLQIFLGQAIDFHNSNVGIGGANVYTTNLWVSYDLTKDLTVAAEAIYSDTPNTTAGYEGLALATYKFDSATSLTGRISGGNGHGTAFVGQIGQFEKYTLAPAYVLKKVIAQSDLTLKGELSWSNYSGVRLANEHSLYYGVGGVLSF